jgi:N-hydroxyarylamine O-acetyltransferase
MELGAYLARIGYDGPINLDLTTLAALHRAHLQAIPYENLNIHLGRELSLDQGRIFHKLVEQRRGGWCFEMNGLFAWALRQIGFDVQLLSSAVGRQGSDDEAEGNHLILLATLDRPYLADVGFGNGIFEPLPLEAGEHQQGWMRFKLAREGERWFYENTSNGGPGFDFTLEPRELGYFARQCHTLQTSPDSGFVKNTVSFRFTPQGFVNLRGAVFNTTSGGEVTTRTIVDAQDYATTLTEEFGLDIPEAPALWEAVYRRHLAWLEEQQVAR